MKNVKNPQSQFVFYTFQFQILTKYVKNLFDKKSILKKHKIGVKDKTLKKESNQLTANHCSITPYILDVKP